MSILHKDICNCTMRYNGSPDSCCGVNFSPGEYYKVYATENRLTSTVTAHISARGTLAGMLGHYAVIPYANIDIFYKIWEPIF